MKAPIKPSAPAYLQPATRAWWEVVTAHWDLQEHHVRLLTLAAEAWDRGQEARQQILRDGLTTGTKAGGLRAHPALRSGGLPAGVCTVDSGAGPRPRSPARGVPARTPTESQVSRKIRTPKGRTDLPLTAASAFTLMTGELATVRLPGWVGQCQDAEKVTNGHDYNEQGDALWAQHGDALRDQAAAFEFEPFWSHKRKPSGPTFDRWHAMFLASYRY